MSSGSALPARLSAEGAEKPANAACGSAKPARVHFRDPSFVNLQSLREMCVGGYIADLIQNLAMLDPILGGIDR